MLIPVIPLPENSPKESSLSKQLIQHRDYSIPLIPHSHQKLSCLKSGVKVGSHDPFLDPIIFLALALSQLIEILIRMTNFFESE